MQPAQLDVELLRSWEEGSVAPTSEDLESLAYLGLAPADVAKVARMLEIVRRDR